MGHENTGEVVEVGLACREHQGRRYLLGALQRCMRHLPELQGTPHGRMLNANEELGFCGAYGFNLGGWQGGQAEYMLVPWADFQLLKFPDKDQAIEKIRDLTLLSDILPTGYHGCVEARVGTGSTVYIAGAGPVGRCAAASAQLLGRLASSSATTTRPARSGKKAGYEVVDPSSATPVADQIEKTSRHGSRWVDAAVDCVGLECHGYGPEGTRKNIEEAVINTLMEVIKPAGAMGIPGVYTNLDPGAPTRTQQKGLDGLGLSRSLGQIANIHRRSMPGHALQPRSDDGHPVEQDALSDAASKHRGDPAEGAVEAYKIFHDGSPKKYVIDPHNMTKLMSTG